MFGLKEKLREYSYDKLLKRNGLNTFSRINTHLSKYEKWTLYELARHCPGSTYVEIGSYLGASACFIGAGICAKNTQNNRLYCIDTWQNDAMTEGYKDTLADFLSNTVQFSEFISVLQGQSVAVGKTFEGKIDFLFIDGDHSYAAVKEDVNTWLPKLNSSAIIVFHDVGWAEGVQRVIREDVLCQVKDPRWLPNLFWAMLK